MAAKWPLPNSRTRFDVGLTILHCSGRSNCSFDVSGSSDLARVVTVALAPGRDFDCVTIQWWPHLSFSFFWCLRSPDLYFTTRYQYIKVRSLAWQLIKVILMGLEHEERVKKLLYDIYKKSYSDLSFHKSGEWCLFIWRFLGQSLCLIKTQQIMVTTNYRQNVKGTSNYGHAAPKREPTWSP